MKNNERGGIISKLFIIPAGLVLMAGFFFLGYYVGRYGGKSTAPSESMPPLPEVVSKNLPKPEEFTFFKTLTEKDNRTVSIDLKPKSAAGTEGTVEKKQIADAPKGAPQQAAQENVKDTTNGRKASQQDIPKPAPVKKSPAPAKKELPAKQASSKLRYTIQVSSHQEKQDAEDEVRRMKQNGFAASVISSPLPGKGTWYRVRVGSFSNREAAERLQREVRAKIGISPIIVLQ